MSNHPVNLAVRFGLEIASLVALSAFGWRNFSATGIRILLALGLPLLAALLWGIFRVPGDPGPAPVPVPGWLRLGLELVFFAAAVAALFITGLLVFGWILLVAVVIHYALSYDRIVRLWQYKQ